MVLFLSKFWFQFIGFSCRCLCDKIYRDFIIECVFEQ